MKSLDNLPNNVETMQQALNISQQLATGEWWLEDAPNRLVRLSYQAQPTDEWGRTVDRIETPFVSSYDEEEYQNPALRVLNIAEFAMLARALRIAPPWQQQERQRVEDSTRILDVGCGTGRIALYAATLGANVTAIDQTAGYVVATAIKASRLPIYVVDPILRVTPVEAELQRDEIFDVTSAMFAVLNHCKDWRSVLKGLTAKSGKIMLSMYGSPEAAVFTESLPYELGILVKRVAGGIQLGEDAEDILPAQFPYPSEVVACLEDSGFIVEQKAPFIPVTSLYPKLPTTENIREYLDAINRRYGSEVVNAIASYTDDPNKLLAASAVADQLVPSERINEAAYYGLVAVKKGEKL